METQQSKCCRVADLAVFPQVQWKLTVALLLCFAFMIVEFVGGIMANR